jgi:hypothetical protein
MSNMDYNDLCNSQMQDIIPGLSKFNNSINSGKVLSNTLSSQINSMVGNTLSETSGLLSAVDNELNKINQLGNNFDLGYADNALSLAACLGINTNLNLPSTNGKLPSLSKILNGILGAKLNYILGLFDQFLDPLEKGIAQGLSALQGLFKLDDLDYLLEVIQCLQGCSNSSTLPSIIDIESDLESAGLDINLNPDFNSEIFTSQIIDLPNNYKTHYVTLGDKLTESTNLIKTVKLKSPF